MVDVCLGGVHDARPALHSVSFNVAAGEIVGVVGAADAGRTALLQIATGMVQPDSGTVTVGRLELTRLSRRKCWNLLGDRIALMDIWWPQPREYIHEIVALPLFSRGLTIEEATAIAWDLLEQVGATALGMRRLSALSRWERILVAIARAIAGRPQLIVADDLFDDLGLRSMKSVRKLLNSLLEELQCGLLFGVSSLEWTPFADQLWCLDQGTIVPMPTALCPNHSIALASELYERGYEGPAAAIAGCALEEHLRRLAERSDVPILREDGLPRTAAYLNHALARAGVYNGLQEKAVTAWLDLRNNAVHGQHASYDRAQVSGLIRDVKDLMRRLPA